MTTIEAWNAEAMQQGLADLARILLGCVETGASVGFIHPFTRADATHFWQSLVPDVASGGRQLFIARHQGQVAATVSLITATPANQPHRGEISKLLVHPDHRRLGLARQLMSHAEAVAKAAGKTLLTLDTRTGDSAEPLYWSLGFETAGVIPNYCLDVNGTTLDATTYLFKAI